MVAPRGERFFETDWTQQCPVRHGRSALDDRGGHMRTRSLGLTLFGSAAILLSACTSGATPSPSASQAPAPSVAAPSTEASAEASAPASVAPSVAQAPDLKIGVVTDIGTLNDKNYNEYSFKGAQQGATAIGAAAPTSIVPTAAADYGPSIKSFIDQKTDVIVTVGFNLAGATGTAAVAQQGHHVHRRRPVADLHQGRRLAGLHVPLPGRLDDASPRTTPRSPSRRTRPAISPGSWPPGRARAGTIGAIGGTSICAPCVRYIQGYELGAKSVNPSIKVVSAYVTNDFSRGRVPGPGRWQDLRRELPRPEQGRRRPVPGRRPDRQRRPRRRLRGEHLGHRRRRRPVPVLPERRAVPPDERREAPRAGRVQTRSRRRPRRTLKAGDLLYDAKNDGIGVSPGHDNASAWAPDAQAKIDAALAGMKDGSLKTCPDKCGVARGIR